MPHCEGEIELDDDASGEFACPLCDGEFKWNVEEDESFDDAVTHTDNRIMSSEEVNELVSFTKMELFWNWMTYYRWYGGNNRFPVRWGHMLFFW